MYDISYVTFSYLFSKEITLNLLRNTGIAILGSG